MTDTGTPPVGAQPPGGSGEPEKPDVSTSASDAADSTGSTTASETVTAADDHTSESGATAEHGDGTSSGDTAAGEAPPVAPAAAYPPQPPYGTYPGPTGPLGRPRPIGMSILLAIVTLGIYCFVWVYQTQKEIKDHSGIGVGGGLGLLIYFLIGIVTIFLVPSEINEMMRLSSRESRVTGLTGFWALIPIAGAFIWFFKVQGQLNEYWESLGAPPP